MRKEQFEIAQLQQSLQSDVVGGHVKHKDKHSFRGTSVAKEIIITMFLQKDRLENLYICMI